MQSTIVIVLRSLNKWIMFLEKPTKLTNWKSSRYLTSHTLSNIAAGSHIHYHHVTPLVWSFLTCVVPNSVIGLFDGHMSAGGVGECNSVVCDWVVWPAPRSGPADCKCVVVSYQCRLRWSGGTWTEKYFNALFWERGTIQYTVFAMNLIMANKLQWPV